MKRFFVFSLVIVLTFTVTLAFFTCFAFGDEYDGDGTRSFYWHDRNICFDDPDMYYVVSDPYQVVRPNLDSIGDVEPFAFRYITDSLGTEQGVALSLTYTGGFEGGLNYTYYFSFDIFHLLGNAGMIYPYNYQFKISAFCDYAAHATILESTGNNIEVYGNEQIEVSYIPEGNGEAVVFTCIYMPEGNYRVNIKVVATSPVDFNLCGILIESWQTWIYEPAIDGVFATPDVQKFEDFSAYEDSILDGSGSGVQSALEQFNYIFTMPQLLRSALLSATTIFDGLIYHLNTIKSVLYFSLALGILASALAITHSVVSSFKSKGGKD